MKQNTSDLLNRLVNQLENKEDFDQVRDQLMKRGVESLLKAEMTAHLGYKQGANPIGDNIRNGYCITNCFSASFGWSMRTVKLNRGNI